MDGPFDLKWVAQTGFESGFPLQPLLVLCPVGLVRVDPGDPLLVRGGHEACRATVRWRSAAT